MFRKPLTVALLVVSLLISPLSSLADEGMWLPDSLSKLPLAEMKKRGFELKPEDIYSLTKPSLKDAIVQISIGGTGSFVSPEGLILTNHHVAFAAITRASTSEKDYINNGFLAKSRAEEIPAQGYFIKITQDFKDVTAEVLSAVKPEMSFEARLRAITLKQEEIGKANSREKEGIDAQVVEASGGYQYFLYTYLKIRDVRLVYAPPKSIGYYGGDPDNFEWPRHCGDFAFLRAYVGPDGNPAGFNKANAPFKPKKFLPINATGIKEGDFSMVMGYPGTTFRLRESYSVEYRQNIQLPDQIAALRQQIDTLTKVSEKDPQLKIRFADRIFSLSNALKAYEGAVVGLKRMDLVARKRVEESEMKKWVGANQAAKAKYGETLPQLESLYLELTANSLKQNALNGLLNSGNLIEALEYAYERALSRDLPANERALRFSDQALPMVTEQLSSDWEEREPEAESKMMVAALARLADLPTDRKIQAVDKLFEGKSGKERRDAEAEFASKTIEGSKFKSFDEVKKLFTASAADLRAIDDPAMKLVIAVVDENSPLAKKQTQILNTIAKVRPQYIAAIQEFRHATNSGLALLSGRQLHAALHLRRRPGLQTARRGHLRLPDLARRRYRERHWRRPFQRPRKAERAFQKEGLRRLRRPSAERRSCRLPDHHRHHRRQFRLAHDERARRNHRTGVRRQLRGAGRRLRLRHQFQSHHRGGHPLRTLPDREVRRRGPSAQ